MELAENFFSQKSVAHGRSVTPFFLAKRPLSPPKKNCLSSEANIGLFVQNFDNGSTLQLRSICGGNDVSGYPNAHPQPEKVLKHLIYVCHGHGMQSEKFYRLNQRIEAWFAHLHQVGIHSIFLNLREASVVVMV
jgi:hypothetical protein